jgi:gliding motility-associated-like protein
MYLYCMRKNLPLFLLIVIGLGAWGQSVQFKKVFTDSTIAAYCASVVPYIDSGYIVQSNSTGLPPVNLKQRIIQLDKNGNVKRQKEISPVDLTKGLGIDNYTRGLVVKKNGSLYSYSALTNSVASYFSEGVLFHTDSNLNVLWSKRITNVFSNTTNNLAELNDQLFFCNVHAYDTVMGPNVGHLADIVLYKFDSNGNMLFGKRYANDYSINGQVGSLFTTSKNQVLLASTCMNKPVALLPDTVMFGFILLLDTNGNIQSYKRYNNFYPSRIYETRSGEFLITGHYSVDTLHQQGYTAVGLFDSLLNPIWVKRTPATSYMPYLGMAEDESGHFILLTEIDDSYINRPLIQKMDKAGNILESYAYNEFIIPFHKLTRDVHGHFMWSSYKLPNTLIMTVTDTIGLTDNCSIRACVPALTDLTLTQGTIHWGAYSLPNVVDFPLNAVSVNAATQDYCSNPGKLNAAFTLAEDTVCPGEPFTLTSSPNLQMGTSEWIIRDSVTGYYKQVNVSAIKQNTPGTYPITHIHTLFGCADTIVHDLVVRVRLSAVNDTVSFCDTSTTAKIISAVPGSSSYTWNTGENTPQITVSQSGIYTYAANYGCGKDTGYVTVTIHHAGALNLADDTLVCADKLPLLIGIDTGFTAYLWNTGATTGLISVADSGTYTLVATNSCGQQTDSIQVSVTPMPEGNNAATYLNIGAGNTARLDACATGANYTWAGPSILEDHQNYVLVNPLETTNYLCKVETEFGCEAMCSYVVVIQNYLIVPTAFSPNGDGVNDVFRLLNRNIKLKQMNVYNRWGELIYSTNDLLEGWDGTYKGVEQPLGTYVWTAEYMEQDKLHSAKGNVTLMR